MLDLISRIGFNCRIWAGSSPSNKNYNIYSKQLWEYLSQFGRSAEKFIPQEFLKLDKEYLDILYKGYTNGDSHVARSSLILSSKSKRLMENIQEIILKTQGRIVQINTYKAKQKSGNICTLSRISMTLNGNGKSYTRYNQPEIFDYNDEVFSLLLPKNHVMLMRHNGVIGWNCSFINEELVLQINKENHTS